MNSDLDPTSIDWNSPDLKPLIEHFKAKFERQDEIIQRQDQIIKQQDERSRQLEADLKRRDEEIAQLKAVIKKMGGKTSTV